MTTESLDLPFVKSEIDVDILAAELDATGGFTLDVRYGSLRRGSGYVVANPEGNVVVKVPRFTFEAMLEALESNREALNAPNRFLGGWRDNETGIVYLETSEIVESLEEAIRLGKARGEIAIFNLGTMTEIRL